MRLLFLSSSFPNHLSATRGTFNLALMRALAQEHDVRVVSPLSWTDEVAARLRGTTSTARAMDFGPRLHAIYPRFYYPPGILRSRYGRFLWWSIRRTILDDIRKHPPDAVISYWAHPDGEAALRAGESAGVPVVSMVGGSDVLLLGRSGARRKAILRVLHGADAVVPVSRNLYETLLSDGLPESKLVLIPRGVDRKVFHGGDRAEARRQLNLPVNCPLLVAVGRLVPVKGFDVLVEACRLLKESLPGVLCCIAGNGPLHGKLALEIERSGVSESVRLVGGKSQSELVDWYRAADLTVLTSHSEGIPNVLLESLCCGTPFVATCVGGIPDIADERYHSLVPPGDPHSLAAAIRDRLVNPPRPGSHPSFLPPTWNEAARRLTDLIEELRRPKASPITLPEHVPHLASHSIP